MDGESAGLLSPCCDRCSDSEDSRCEDWLACRTAGPFCHEDVGCSEAKTAAAHRIAFGPGALVGVGQGDCGRGKGSGKVLELLRDGLPAGGFEVIPTGCLGFCSAEPLVWVARPAEPVALFGEIGPDDAAELARRLSEDEGWPEKTLAFLHPSLAEERTFRDNRHLYTVEEVEGDFYPFFLDKQMRIVTAHCGLARPTSLDDYLMRLGLHPLFILLRHLTPEEAFDILGDAGLESRSTGEPVAPGWSRFAGTEGGEILLDLRDGGANPPPLTRRLLEGVPFQVLESLLLLGLLTRTKRVEIVLPADWTELHATAVPQGGLRRRYAPSGDQPAANLRSALETLRARNLVGEHILGTDYSCAVEIVNGPAGDGETLGVDLETVLNLPTILEMGGDWFHGYGHGRHHGTKCLLVGGPLTAKGFLELNLGTPLGDVVNLICGGGSEGPFTGVAPGGDKAVPVDFDSILDFPDAEPLPGPPILGAPGLLEFQTDTGPAEPEPMDEKEPAGISGSPLKTLLARYGEITPPAGLPVSVSLGWRIAGQRLRLLVQYAGDEAEFIHAGRTARHLSRYAPPEMARWASDLVNTLHTQS